MSGTRSSAKGTTSTLMVPSQPHPPPAKRKAADDTNPLNAVKRAKTDQGKPAGKRKLLNAEEKPGGLLIVRAPSASRPPSAQSHHPPPAARAHTNPPEPPPPAVNPPPPPPPEPAAGPSRPPAKKFRADARPPSSKRKSASQPSAAPDAEPDVERDVRAMEDEADDLRRRSRAAALHPAFRFPTDAERMTETSIPVPAQETPQIVRNKQLREAAMAQIRGDLDGRAAPTTPMNTGAGHRRKSSVSARGKRISSSFQATGVISQPHNSVSETSFHKHIDCDLPPASRLGQLLIWSSSRSAVSAFAPPLNLQAKSKGKSKDQPPPLSAAGATLLKGVHEGLSRMLAEKRLDTRVSSRDVDGGKPETVLKENPQNVKNRKWKVIYERHIERVKAEDEAWKEVDFFYKSHVKDSKAKLEKTRLQRGGTPSAKSLGKQRATDPDDDAEWDTWAAAAPDSRAAQGIVLARSVLAPPTTSTSHDDRIVGGPSTAASARAQKEAALRARLGDVEWKLDHLHVLAGGALQAARAAEGALDARFAQLGLSLAPPPPPPPGAGGAAGTLGAYAPRQVAPDPRALLRALTYVDAERPPALVGDAARRAVREVQRAGEGGERRLTGVAVPATPRKAPGTPRRGTTPGRER